MNYKADYNNHKQSVIDLLDLVIDFYNNYSDPEKLSALESIKSSVENGTFSITVIGQFSAGKSTFLNALMGEKYLPSYTSETTATINFLESVSKSPINKPCIKVLYRDKSEKIIEDVCIENIEKYVSTRGTDVAKNVESVNLFLDSRFLNDGVCLVDSPGLNGIKEGHAEITNQQIDRSHAAIFMFNAKQPGSKTDFEILKKVIERCNSVFIVLNQIDQINTSEESVESVIENLKKNYREIFPNAPIPEIHPLSSYLALVGRSSQKLSYHNENNFSSDKKKEFITKSQVPIFENRLFKFLTHGEKTKQELLEPINKVNVFLTETRNTINESISMLEGSTDVSEIQQKISSLQDEINSLNKEIGNNKQAIRNNVSDILNDAENKIKSETREIKERYLQRIEEEDEIEELETNSELYIKNIQATYIDIISRIIDKANDEYYNLINEKYCEFTSKIEKKINDTQIENNFQVSLDKSYFQLDIDLDDYIERRKELKESKAKKEKDIINTESEVDEAYINDEKRQLLEREKSEAAAEFNNNIAIMGNRPSVVHYNKVIYEKNWGIGGGLKWLWNGNPAKPKTISATDSSDRDSWDKKMNDIQNSHSKRISELQKQLESIPPTSKARLETKMKQLEREKERIDEELRNLEAEKNKQIAESKKKKIKSAKAYLQSYILDMENNQLNSTYKKIKECKEDMIKTLVEVVSEGVSKNITRKTELLETNKKMMESSVEQKEESLKQLKENNDKIGMLLEKVNESKVQIDSIEIDEIKRD